MLGPRCAQHTLRVLMARGLDLDRLFATRRFLLRTFHLGSGACRLRFRIGQSGGQRSMFDPALLQQIARLTQRVLLRRERRSQLNILALALSGVATRAEAEAALRTLERKANTRAEALEPQEFVALAKALP